jgi:hypothetical protein
MVYFRFCHRFNFACLCRDRGIQGFDLHRFRAALLLVSYPEEVRFFEAALCPSVVDGLPSGVYSEIASGMVAFHRALGRPGAG